MTRRSAVERYALMGSVILTGLGLQAATPSPAEDPTANLVLEGQVLFPASSGQTVTYSGKYTGTGTAVIDGGGTVIFSNGGNSYSGGTLVTNAVFQVNATGAAGTGAISNMANTAHLFINCPRLVNDVYYKGIYNSANYTELDTSAGKNPLFPMVDTVLDGSVTAEGAGSFFLTTGYGSTVKRNLEITGCVRAKREIGIGLFGNVTIRGSVTCGSSYGLNCAMNYRCKGRLTLCSSSNSAMRIQTYNGTYSLMAEDALPDTELFWKNDNGVASAVSDPLANAYYLNGCDQVFSGLSWTTDARYLRPGENFAGWGVYAGSSESDTAAATVRITGRIPAAATTGQCCDLWAGLFGNLTYVLDASDPTADGWYQNFTNRCSTMTGNLIISNGDFRVTGTASFPNVPEIYVGTGGRFSCTTTRIAAFDACTNLTVDGTMAFAADVPSPFAYKKMHLTLGENSELTLPTASAVTVLSLKVGEQEIPEGTTIKAGDIPQLKAGSIAVEGIHERTEATWTGNGADDALTTAENWSTAPNVPSFSDYTLAATFATGGRRAVLSSDALLYGLTLNRAGGFSFDGAGTKIALREGGLSFVAGTPMEDAYYCFEPQLEFLTPFDLNLAVPENVTLNFDGGLKQEFSGTNVKAGDGALRLGGEGQMVGSFMASGGSFAFSGDWEMGGCLSVTNAAVTMTGDLMQIGGVNPNPYEAKGTREDYVVVQDAEEIRYDGFTCGKRFLLRPLSGTTSRSIGDGKILFVANTTNEFMAHVYFDNPKHITVGSQSEVRFDKGLGVDGSTSVSSEGSQWGNVTGKIVFGSAVTKLSADGLAFYNTLRVRFEMAGNAVTKESSDSWGRSYHFASRSCCEAAVDNIFDSDVKYDWQVLFDYSSVFDLGTTSQYIGGKIKMLDVINQASHAASIPSVVGQRGSRLRLNKGRLESRFADSVSLVCEGTNYVTEVTVGKNAEAPDIESTTDGDVEVVSGLLHFEAGVMWPNVSNVIVRAEAEPAGRLKLDSQVFGKNAVLRLDAGARVELAAGVSQRCAGLWIDGKQMAPGQWGAPGSGAVHTSPCITGDGFLNVRGGGIVLIVR